jgi:hypothetical protein
MGKYWSVDECRWVTWTPTAAADAAEAAEVPQPRDAAEPQIVGPHAAPVQG